MAQAVRNRLLCLTVILLVLPGRTSIHAQMPDYHARDFVDEITTLQNGDHLVMGRDMLYVLDGTTYELRMLDVPGARENTNFAFQAPNRLVWLATGAGLHCFDSHMNHLAANIPLPREELITTGFLTASGKLLFATDTPLRLRPFEKSIEVEFNAPYFNNPEKIKYRYWLEGYDHSWKSLGNNNSFRLTSLPGGDYNLRLQASLNGVDWVEARQSLVFTIDKWYWEKPWFVLLLTGAFAGLAVWFIHNRNQKVREKQEELDAELTTKATAWK